MALKVQSKLYRVTVNECGRRSCTNPLQVIVASLIPGWHYN